MSFRVIIKIFQSMFFYRKWREYASIVSRLFLFADTVRARPSLSPARWRCSDTV